MFVYTKHVPLLRVVTLLTRERWEKSMQGEEALSAKDNVEEVSSSILANPV
jgi:hypothetical protein